MLFINKRDAPQALVDSVKEMKKTGYATPCYKSLSTEVKHEVLQSLLEEQGYLCAYCMQEIDGEAGSVNKAHIEHYHPQNPSARYREKLGKHFDKDEMSVDYGNLLAVCDGGERSLCPERTCDKSRNDDNPLAVDPLNQATIDQISYREDGTITSDNEAIRHDLEVELNLNCVAFSFAKQRKDQIVEFNKAIYALQDAQGNPDKKRILHFCRQVRQILNASDGGKKPRFAGIILWRIEQLNRQLNEVV